MAMNLQISQFPQQGWVCPVCGKVLAPWVSECDCYKQRTTLSNDNIVYATTNSFNFC